MNSVCFYSRNVARFLEKSLRWVASRVEANIGPQADWSRDHPGFEDSFLCSFPSGA